MTHCCRFTVKCKILASYPAKGISPDYMKDRLVEEKAKGLKGKVAVPIIAKEIEEQTSINEKYNKRGIELGDILIEKLKDVDMTWCNDGCVVVSCNNTIAEVEQVILDEGLEIKPDISEIKHKVRSLDPLDEKSAHEEDIDLVFEPKTLGELKKLKSKIVVNKHNHD